MRFNNRLDLNLLVALDHLLHLRNVSAAAARMNMTQSAMSSALQRLRDYFEDELLAKAGRNMELTPRAESLKVSVRDLLVRIEGTVAASSQFDPSRSERCFTIVACEYALATIAPALLRHCERIAPDVKFNLVSQLAAPERLLEQGTADLLIIPKEFCWNRYPSEVILYDDYCAVAWSRGHYASRKLSRKEFSRAPHVVMRAAEDRQSPETHLMTQRVLERRIDVTTDSFSALPGLVAGTNRIATTHRRLAKEAIGRLPIKIVELPFKLPPMQLSVQWHKYRSNDTALIWLLEMIRATARNLG
ncbi:LysR family transcriptional regulator [Bradyrhizobium sp. Ec3.3]|uniref:LysR family transcriptional regulator n=1 Tax=Bradyrhizobium sp. Ec3.3 TaxID=189753 RepID=UPI000405B84A|nr:LysR family transcriptional regulator [Bradyrhizobium sp. Ec3.3]